MNNHTQQEYMDLIQTHEGIIHKVIGIYVDYEEDKKDLYQEVLLQSWKSYARYEGKSSFSTWLYKVALNTVLNFHKRHKKTTDINTIVEPEVEVVRGEDYDILHKVIRALNEIDRMLITLYLEGYKNKEIAEITGITPNNVNVKIHRIKAIIIEQFNKVTK